MCCWGALGLTTLLCSLQTSRCVLWPAGSYGLPKSTSGCPLSDGFQWKTGWRIQDTNDKFSHGVRSEEFHLDGEVDTKKVNRSFCIKTNTAEDVYENHRTSWPSGKYCVYKKGAQCPAGLEGGYVYWDDHGGYFNLNNKGGILPSGDYGHNTMIEFCCATDGVKNRPILFPTEVPFFLLAHASEKCQMVKWAIATQEWIHFGTASFLNDDDRKWPYPYNAGQDHPIIYYCYYRGCNKTLNGVKGTFHSPNYPNNYPDGQYCSWRITVNPMQQIHLTFTDFNLQSENNTDVLYVYDAQNATGEVLGLFYGDNRPPENGINSTTNNMFLIFKSDDTISGVGFNASYHAVNNSAVPTFTTTEIPTQEIASTTSKTFLYSSSKTTFDMEATSTTDRTTKESGEKDQRQQSQEKGLNVVAVVVPLVALIFLAALLIAGFAFHKRRRMKKQEQARSKRVIFSRSNDEQPVSLENPYYDSKLVKMQNELYSNVKEDYRSDKETSNKQHQSENLLSGENEVYSNVTEDCKSDEERYKQQENELYAEFEVEYTTDKGTYKGQESENPLYESAGPDVVPGKSYL